MKNLKDAIKRPNHSISLLYDRYQHLIEKRQIYFSTFAFFLGILWDVLTIGRIDQWSNIVQLGLYTFVTMCLVLLELVESYHEGVKQALARLEAHKFLKLILGLRVEVTHFLMGSLLSAFAIFFVKSASLWSSLGFLLLFGGVLVANELQSFRRLGLQMRVCFVVVCAASYLSCLVPLITKKIGWLPFSISLFFTLLLFLLSMLLIGKIFSISHFIYEKHLPIVIGTLGAFGVFYLCGWIPPVPLALTKIGIYRDVQRSGNVYELKHMKNPWAFWQRGEQNFHARVGDKVYVFFSVFAPSGFKEILRVKWYFNDPEKGLDLRDTMDVRVLGGRDAGYRGFAYKSKYQTGDWIVSIETADQREVGQLRFSIREDLATEPRLMLSEFF